jgi:hypothetical protein
MLNISSCIHWSFVLLPLRNVCLINLPIFLFKFYFTIFTFTYMCIHYLGHLPSPLFPGRTCSALLENIRDKKNIAFWLIQDKDNYALRFLVLFPCICVLKPILVHLCKTSSLLPSPHSGFCQFKTTIFSSIQ